MANMDYIHCYHSAKYHRWNLLFTSLRPVHTVKGTLGSKCVGDSKMSTKQRDNRLFLLCRR